MAACISWLSPAICGHLPSHSLLSLAHTQSNAKDAVERGKSSKLVSSEIRIYVQYRETSLDGLFFSSSTQQVLVQGPLISKAFLRPIGIPPLDIQASICSP